MTHLKGSKLLIYFWRVSYFKLFNSIPYNNNNSESLWYYLWYRNGAVLLLHNFYIMELNTWFKMKKTFVLSVGTYYGISRPFFGLRFNFSR